jgi:hypothetical protein
MIWRMEDPTGPVSGGAGGHWPVPVIAVVSVLFCWPWLWPGRVLLPIDVESVWPWTPVAEGAPRPGNALLSDSLTLTYTSRLYNHVMLRRGRVPFWNPHILCGTPHFALIQNNSLYPLTVPFDFAEPVAGMAYSICLHLALAGVLMYLFLRRSGLDAGAAMVGGFVFQLNGMFLTRLGMPCFVFSGTWIPLLLLGVDGLVRARRLYEGWPLLVGTALSILGGHPQITSLGLAMAAAYLAWRISTDDAASGERGRLRVLASFATLVVLAGAICGFQLVPFLELAVQSAREPVPLATYRNSGVPAAALLQAFIPRIYGDPVQGTYWFDRWSHLLDGVPPGQRYWSLNASGENLYTGVAPLMLSAVALARSRRRELCFFALAALTSVAVFLRTPLLDAAYWLLPGFRYSRPDRVLLVYMTALSVLAALGVEAVGVGRASGPSGRLRPFAWAAGALLAWVVLPFALRPERRAGLSQWAEEAVRQWTQHRGQLALDVALTLALVGGAMILSRGPVRAMVPARVTLPIWSALILVPSMLFGWHFNPAHRVPPIGSSDVERFLVDNRGGGRLARILSGAPLLFPANVPEVLALDDVHGVSAATPAAYVRLMQALDPPAVQQLKYFACFRDPRVATGRMLDFLNVAFILSDRDLPLPRVFADPAHGVAVFRNPRVLPRFLVVPEAVTYRDPAEALSRLLSPAFDSAQTALVPASQAALLPGRGFAPHVPATVTVQASDAHATALRVQSDGGLLVSSEAYYPGWRAWIDGQATDILLVNTAFRGVWLPAGSHEVRFRFVPHSFYLGLTISLAGLAGVAWIFHGHRRQ